MAFPGQPTPSTVVHNDRNPVSDGKSVKVTVAGPIVINKADFYLINGWFGCAFDSVTLAPLETAQITLNIEPAEYETDQINALQMFAVGDLVYWDAVVGEFTTTAANNRLVGQVTVARDLNGVVWFVRYPQGVVHRVAAAHANSAAVDVAGLLADYNGLLVKLRAAGLLAQ